MSEHPTLTGQSYIHCECGTTVRTWTEEEAAEVVLCPRCVRGYRLTEQTEDGSLTYVWVEVVQK